MSSVYAPSSKYSRLGHNINLRDGQQFIAYDVGVEEDKYAIPSVGGIDTYDLGLGYSLLTNGNLLNIEVPKLKLEFPDARVGWESFRLVLQADKSIRCYFLLVQKNDYMQERTLQWKKFLLGCIIQHLLSWVKALPCGIM